MCYSLLLRRRLALSGLYEWMGVALLTGSEAAVSELGDRRWRAAGEGWPGVKHNWT